MNTPALRRAVLRTSGLIVCAALVSHFHVLWGDWVWDDYALIVNNPAVRSLRSLSAQLTQPFLGIFWRPSVTVSYTLEHALWGLRPAGMHATNLLLHTCAAVLVAALWRRLTDRVHLPLLAGLLFAVHGAHYQPAAIAARTGLLCTTFCLFAWWSALRAGAAWGLRALGWGALALGAYIVALGAKEEAVVLPVLMLVVGVLQPWPIDGPAHWKRAAPAACGMTVLALGYLIARGRILGGDGLVATTLPALPQRVLSAPAWLAHHWRDAVLPLWVDVEYRGLVWPHLPLAHALAGWGILGGAIAVAWRTRHTHRELLVALAWGLVVWLPTSNLVPVYPETAAQHVFMPPHFLYFPNTGLMGAVAACGLWLVARRRAAGWAVVGALLALHTVCTVRINYVWMDDVRLYRYVLRLHPQHPLMWRNLGLALAYRGDLAGAAGAYQRSLDAKPSAEAHLGLGLVRQQQDSWAEAERAFEACAALEPTKAECYVALARLYAARGATERAVAVLERGLAAGADPDRLAAERTQLRTPHAPAR